MKNAAIAVVVGLLASFCSYPLLDWAFIKIWEWRHDGRRMKITISADYDAMLTAFLIGLIVFALTIRYLRRRKAN